MRIINTIRISGCPDSEQGLHYETRCPDRAKLVFWDGTGVVLVAKRLEEGVFRWPRIEDGVVRLGATELSALLEGLDWRRVHAARQVTAPAVAG